MPLFPAGRVLDVDLRRPAGHARRLPDHGQAGFGHIVNTSSAGAFFPLPGNAPYGTAKNALIGLSPSLRLEGADLGGEGQLRLSTPPTHQRLPERGGSQRDSARRRVPGEAGRRAGQDDGAITGGSGDPGRRGAQQGAIVLPASVRWLRRVNQLLPGLIERGLFRQFRQRQQRVRAAGIVAREPDIASAP